MAGLDNKLACFVPRQAVGRRRCRLADQGSGRATKELSMNCNRRHLLAAALAAPLIGRARAAESKTLRIGFQKGDPVLMAAKANRDLETRLAPQGIEVAWTEFQFGPPLLEAMRAGSIDIGSVGDTPAVFAQAAHADLLYVAERGSPQDAVLLPPGSKIQALSDLKGKKLAFARGSSAHNFAAMVLEKAGLHYDDIQPVYLDPADAGAAFMQGAIDAWSIWDPYYALFDSRPGVRTLASNKDVGAQFGFFLGHGPFVRGNPALTVTVLQALATTAAGVRTHQPSVAALLAGSTGIAPDVWARSLSRNTLQIGPVSADLARTQQKVADRMQALGLVPAAVTVAPAVWHTEGW
jgi:aliphatic sulfonates family ABC transporter substrate-binding protein